MEICGDEVDVPGRKIGLKDIHNVQTQSKKIRLCNADADEARQNGFRAEFVALPTVNVDKETLDWIVMPDFLNDEEHYRNQADKGQ